jgi:hypothetical protein
MDWRPLWSSGALLCFCLFNLRGMSSVTVVRNRCLLRFEEAELPRRDVMLIWTMVNKVSMLDSSCSQRSSPCQSAAQSKRGCRWPPCSQTTVLYQVNHPLYLRTVNMPARPLSNLSIDEALVSGEIEDDLDVGSWLYPTKGEHSCSNAMPTSANVAGTFLNPTCSTHRSLVKYRFLPHF